VAESVSVADGLSFHGVGNAAVGTALEVTMPEHPETHATVASKIVRYLTEIVVGNLRDPLILLKSIAVLLANFLYLIGNHKKELLTFAGHALGKTLGWTAHSLATEIDLTTR
jgi:hypothetical protein